MAPNRRDFIKSSGATTLIAVSKVSGARAQNPRMIGIVHSTVVDTPLNPDCLACFKAGLRSQNWEEEPTAANKSYRRLQPKEARGQYGGTHGHKELRKFVRLHGAVHLIVAAGGVSSQKSALEELYAAPRPFVYLSGRMPNPPSSADGKYCGVVLNTAGQYQQAVQRLVNSQVPSNAIWLVQNFNSDMTQDEQPDWVRISGNSNCFRFFEPQGPDYDDVDNDESLFQSEVTRLGSQAPTPRAVVVNPDAFFRMKAVQLRTQLDTLNIPVCYPFKDYNPTGLSFLLPNGAMLSSSNAGEIENTAYYQLGVRAADVLDHSTADSPIPTTRLSKIWNSTSSTWDNL